MRFRILGHAALEVESGARLVVDPWLSGSCYWESWWHFPPSVPLERPLARGDFVYITHGHSDHLHEPSLREIDRDVTILLPRLPVSYLRDAIDALGFRDVVEIDHGASLALGPDLAVTSYQSGWINDSALVVEAGDVRIADLNDALFVPPLLERIARRHAPIDFVLKSHSSASAYPDCFESQDPADLGLYDESDFIGNFFHYARVCRARYAVPFASNVCFLHDETRRFNRHVISPLRIAEAAAAQPPGSPEVKIMLPGDAWSSEEGFQIRSGDVLAHRESEVARLAEEAADAIARQTRREAARELRFETFERYFGGLLRSLPFPLRWLYRARFGFEVAAPEPAWWIVDFGRARVERTSREPDDLTAAIRVPPGLLDEAIEERLVGFIDISKRLHIALRPGQIIPYAIFKELIGLYESGYLPLWRSLTSRRFLAAWFRRRQELGSYLLGALRGPLSFVPRAPADRDV